VTDGFLREFIEYLKRRSDCPTDFHIHAGMAALSVALGNRVWCDGWARPIYPNLWIVVIAQSGFGKSVPLDMSEALVRKAGLEASVLPDSFSQEALYTMLSQQPSGIFFLQEFSAFLGSLQRNYNEGSVPWLTKIFDVPETDTRVLRSERITLRKPCITILGASSPEWFAESYKASLLGGGFLARFLFCPSEEAGAYVGHPGPRDVGVEVGLADHLRRVTRLAGCADLSAAWNRFNDWDRTAREHLRRNCPPEFSGMRARAGVLVLKAAMLIHVSADPTNLVVSTHDLEQAIEYVERCQCRAERYLTDEVARDRNELHRLRILEIVRRSGGRTPWSRALMNSHLTAREFSEAVITLVQTEQVVVEHGRGKQRNLALPEPVFDRTNGVEH
jgi:Protein of unknown function (DUF3987)